MFYILIRDLSPGCAASGSHGSPALVVPRGADPGRPHAALDQDLGTTTKLKSPKAIREKTNRDIISDYYLRST